MTGTCGVCGRQDVEVKQPLDAPAAVCVDEAACYAQFRRAQGWDALARYVEGGAAR